MHWRLSDQFKEEISMSYKLTNSQDHLIAIKEKEPVVLQSGFVTVLSS